jgi:D-threo-aldose 1-dehydrogenase
MDETYPTLHELRAQGTVGAIGAAMNQWQALGRYVTETEIDCVLLAGRYTLLDQSTLPELLPPCEEKGVRVILGGPYNSGVLASDLTPGAKYFYADASPDVLDRARAIKTVCDRYGVPIKAATLQFGLGHPTIASTIPGARSTRRGGREPGDGKGSDPVRPVGGASPRTSYLNEIAKSTSSALEGKVR